MKRKTPARSRKVFPPCFSVVIIIVLLFHPPFHWDRLHYIRHFSAVHLVHQVERTAFALVEDPSQVFPDDAEREELHPAEAEHHREERGIARYGVAVEHGPDEDIDHVEDRQERHGHAEHGRQPERRRREGREPFQRQIQERPVIPRGLSRRAGPHMERELLLFETHPGEHALRVPLALPHEPERRHAPPVQKAEISYVPLDLRAAALLEQLVKEIRQMALHEALVLPVGPLRAHIVIALPPPADHLRNEFRRMLQVRIHEDHRVALRVVQPGEHGRFLPEIPGKADVRHPRIFFREPPDDAERPVPTAVIHEKEPEPAVRHRREDLPHFRMKFFQYLLLVVAGDDDRDRVHFPIPSR